MQEPVSPLAGAPSATAPPADGPRLVHDELGLLLHVQVGPAADDTLNAVRSLLRRHPEAHQLRGRSLRIDFGEHLLDGVAMRRLVVLLRMEYGVSVGGVRCSPGALQRFAEQVFQTRVRFSGGALEMAQFEGPMSSLDGLDPAIFAALLPPPPEPAAEAPAAEAPAAEAALPGVEPAAPQAEHAPAVVAIAAAEPISEGLSSPAAPEPAAAPVAAPAPVPASAPAPAAGRRGSRRGVKGVLPAAAPAAVSVDAGASEPAPSTLPAVVDAAAAAPSPDAPLVDAAAPSAERAGAALPEGEVQAEPPASLLAAQPAAAAPDAIALGEADDLDVGEVDDDSDAILADTDLAVAAHLRAASAAAPRAEPAEPRRAGEQQPAWHREGDRRVLAVSRTLRSGAIVRFPGDVVVYGDVNAGAHIEAGGNIIVLGSLRGLAHAGAQGDTGAVVLGFDLKPAQLRIADHIAFPEGGAASRSNSLLSLFQRDRSAKGAFSPVVALVRDGHIVLEDYRGRLPG